MKSFTDIVQIVQSFHELGETVAATEFLLQEYRLSHPFLKGFELREAAKPDFVLLTTEGVFGKPQIINIPENAYEFPLEIILNLLAHEMVHVNQKTGDHPITDKNEREWQAYYEMLFHKQFPLIPDASDFHRKQFAKKGLEYYHRMGENSELQKKYAGQKTEVETLLNTLN